MRTLAVLLTLASLAGCNSATSPPKPTPGTGGSPPATGGTSGSGGGAAATGGSIGGGTGGAAVMIDAAPVALIDASSADTASVASDGAPVSSDAVASVDGLPAGIPGHEWVIPCDPSWPKAQCCAHYCGCMAKNCADREPKDCLATCTAPGNNWNLKCKVEQCFESLDPRFPMDHGSHCGHATEAAHCQGIIP